MIGVVPVAVVVVVASGFFTTSLGRLTLSFFQSKTYADEFIQSL